MACRRPPVAALRRRPAPPLLSRSCNSGRPAAAGARRPSAPLLSLQSTSGLSQISSLRGRCFASVVSKLPRQIVDREYGKRGAAIVDAQEMRARSAIGGRRSTLYDRQVLACIAEPSLCDREGVFPEDVRARAARYLSLSADGVASRAALEGEAATALSDLYGHEIPAEEVVLAESAASAAALVFQTVLASDAQHAALLPVPQFPGFGEALSALGRPHVPYFLDDGEAAWDLSAQSLEDALKECAADGVVPKVLVVSNPGHPIGRVLPRATMEQFLAFAARERMVLLADETQQDSLLEDAPSWTSFRSLARELDSPAQVVSLHAAVQEVSRGPAENGLQGCALHCYNGSASGAGSEALLLRLRALAAERPRPSLLSQALLCSALSAGADAEAERAELRSALSRKARMAAERLNGLEGMTCPTIECGGFAYPKVIIKGYVMKKAISFATPADQIYSLELAERTGLGVVPGSVFGQRPGHFHLRIDLSREENLLEEDLATLAKFHEEHPGGWFR
eukprot:TRINITY_DN23207_c0_g4_i1.p1 TRINITY_DN23207_c0_g4~~TRINITY_DN23207_c0_g4_i1.p1  ORF type:complete len:532 (+),score=112.23 TRINITY_DN23207_c0_g4_i1:62-1597(+)